MQIWLSDTDRADAMVEAAKIMAKLKIEPSEKLSNGLDGLIKAGNKYAEKVKKLIEEISDGSISFDRVLSWDQLSETHKSYIRNREDWTNPESYVFIFNEEGDMSIALTLTGSDDREIMEFRPVRGEITIDFKSTSTYISPEVEKMAESRLSYLKDCIGDNSPVPSEDSPMRTHLREWIDGLREPVGLESNNGIAIPDARKSNGARAHTIIIDEGVFKK